MGDILMRIAFLVRINPFTQSPSANLDAQIAEMKNHPDVTSAEKIDGDSWWNCRVVSKETREAKLRSEEHTSELQSQR